MLCRRLLCGSTVLEIGSDTSGTTLVECDDEENDSIEDKMAYVDMAVV